MAYEIWAAAESTVKTILQELEAQFPGCVEAIFPSNKSETVLRFLRYEWQTCGHYLAKPHYDAAALSLAIAEDKPGLRIGVDPKSLQLLQHKEDHAVFFTT